MAAGAHRERIIESLGMGLTEVDIVVNELFESILKTPRILYSVSIDLSGGALWLWPTALVSA